jgi:hypothetical protein
MASLKDDPKRKDIVIVSGLPRSGTSLMMQCLRAGGIAIATDGLRGADEDNPLGYFELEAVKRLRDSPGLVNPEELRGRAVKIVPPLLYCLPSGHCYRVIVMRRNLNEVVASQNIMLERRGMVITETNETMVSVLQRELNRLFDWLRRRTDVSFISIDYQDLVLNPWNAVDAVNAFLGGGCDTLQMSKVVDPSLYRCRARRTTDNPDQRGDEQEYPHHRRGKLWAS